MYKVKIFQIFIFFFTIFNANAQSNIGNNKSFITPEILKEFFQGQSLTNQQTILLERELRIQSILIEGIQEINIINGNYQNITDATNRFNKLFLEAVELRTDHIPANLQISVLDQIKKNSNESIVKKTLKKIKDFANNIILKNYSSLASTARRYGIQVGLLYALTAQIDYTLPLILSSMGHTELGLLLFATPISSTTTASYILAKNAAKYHQLVKKLGGINTVFEHLKIYKEVKQFFGAEIFGNYDLIDVNIQNSTYVLTIKKSGLVDSIKAKLGLSYQLNYNGIADVLKEKNFLVKFMEKLDASQINEQTKLYILLAKIEQLDDPIIFNSLKSKFSSFINEMDYLPEFSKSRKWIIRASSVKSFEELYLLMSRIPNDIPPKTLHRIWKEHILYNSAQSIENYSSKKSYEAFRNLYENYENELRPLLMNSDSYKIQEDLRKKFQKYIYKSLAPVNRCELDFIKFVDS